MAKKRRASPRIRNRLRSLKDIDRSSFYLLAEDGYYECYTLIMALDQLLQDPKSRIAAYQCPCGAVFPHPRRRQKDSPLDANGNILCPKCASYVIDINISVPTPDRIREINPALRGLFEHIRNTNYATFCMFLWQTIRYHDDVGEVLATSTLLREQVAKTDLEIELAAKGIRPVIYNDTYERETRVRLRLLSYAHLLELSPVYDLLYATVQIALGLARVLDHERRSVSAVRIGFDDDEGRMPPHEKVKRIIQATAGTDFQAVGELLDFIFDNRLRNAVAHAQYSLDRDQLRLTHYGMDIPIEQVMEMSEALLALFRRFLTWVYMERERFFDGPPVKEGQFTLHPQRSEAGGYQIRVEM